MPKTVKRFSDKVYGVRFPKNVERTLLTYCIQEDKNWSAVIQEAVECRLMNPHCKAHKKWRR